MQAHELSRDGKAEPQAAVRAPAGAVDLLKALKDRLELVGRDAFPSIADVDGNLAI